MIPPPSNECQDGEGVEAAIKQTWEGGGLVLSIWAREMVTTAVSGAMVLIRVVHNEADHSYQYSNGRTIYGKHYPWV